MTSLADVLLAVDGSGLSLRGGFHPGPADDAPDGVRTLVLLGHAGRDGLWPAFVRDRRDEPNPLDNWTRRTLEPIARSLGATALYPFDEPYLPFQRWAKKAEPVYPSPLGALIDVRYGLWHGYRGALAFDAEIPLPPKEEAPNPCALCREQPCTTACPVSAVTADDGYALTPCLEHLKSPAGAACLHEGCLARRACPVGAHAAYGPSQMRFHMAAFLAAFGDGADN
jgi:hypothetical protein